MKTETNDRERRQKLTRRLRFAVMFLYDVQKLRISASNRDNASAAKSDEAKATVAALEDSDRAYLRMTSAVLKATEAEGDHQLTAILKQLPIWNTWLKDQRGVGPRLGAIMLAYLDPYKAETVSGFWKYAGLAVADDGKAMSRKRGEKCGYNPWLKSKLIKNLGDCLLKAGGKAKGDPGPWVKMYQDERHRQQNKIVTVCQCCNGTGKADSKDEGNYDDETLKTKRKLVKCWNCDGTGGPAPVGNSDAHRHQRAVRKACKALLQELFLRWREIEGLPVRPPYAAEYLATGGEGKSPQGGREALDNSTSTHLQG